MLVDKLYTIKDLHTPENNTILATILINKEHEVFLGHFPGRPIMPGVCLTNMITDVISLSKHHQYFLKSANFIKFLTIVQPETTPIVSIKISISEEVESSLKADALVFSENTTFLKFQGYFNLM